MSTNQQYSIKCNDYGTVGESGGVEIFKKSPIRTSHILPTENNRNKMTIIPDEPSQMTVAFKRICENNDMNLCKVMIKHDHQFTISLVGKYCFYV